MSRHPEVKWAQRADKVFITLLLADSKDAKVNVEPEGVFTFSGTAGTGNNHYDLKLELFDKINVEESKINIGVRSVFCILEKAEKEWWQKLLRGDGKAPHYVKVDWDKWVDEDEDQGTGDLDLGGMDLSSMGGMGGMGGMGDMMGGMGGMGGMPGMGGMGGMGGMPGMAEMMKGMGGMGGMGGMADMMKGMGGMGGMGGMDEFEDSDDEGQEVTKGAELKADKAEGDAVGTSEKKEAEAST